MNDKETRSKDALAIATLSQQLGIAEREVCAMYSTEVARLESQARITSYIAVLALHNTQTRLRGICNSATAHG